MKKIIIVLIFGIFIGCSKKQTSENLDTMESPLSSVIKLISAESFGNLEEAKKYIDIKKVYSKHLSDTINFEEMWKKQVSFKSSLNNNSKFTSHFQYFKYDIKETITDNEAKVEFVPKHTKSKIEKILYVLNKENLIWKIVEIDYIK